MAPLIVHSAHQPGLNTCIAFSYDGLTLHTGGDDGLARVWPLDLGAGNEPEPADEAEEAVTSIATSKTCWLSASLDSCVRNYDVHGTTMEGFVTRAIAVPVRSIAIDPKGERVAVASDELEVKIVSLSNTSGIKKLEGHRKGVRRVTWHPSGKILTTCGSEGDIIVWDLSTDEEPQRIETISGIIPAADPESPEFAYDCSAVWHPSGKYFVVASRTHELVMISRENWQKSCTFSDDDVTGAITALALSPNGIYLATASKFGIFIWSTATKRVLFSHSPTSVLPMVLQLAFSPTQNLLAWTDAEGNLLRWPEPIPDTSPDPVKMHPAPSTNVSVKKKSDYVLFGDDAKDMVNDFVDTDDYGMDDDWMIDDIGLLDNTDKEKDSISKGYAREMVSVTKAQPAFQSASTPMVNKKRYLAYNMIGVIEVTDQDSHHIVNVEFHDRSMRAGSHFQDTHKLDTASLGERGAMYSCLPESGHPAQIVYKPYSGWASSGEWQYSLPVGETVVALAAGGTPPSKSLRDQSSEGDLEGNGNVVVATDRGYLRFLTGGGVQRYLWSLGTDIVTMVAGCEWVFVVHRDGGTTLDGCQNLSYMLVTLDTFDIVQHGQMPLPKNTVLKWIGISEEGAPAMYDSNGLLSILDRFRRPGQARWTPILDTLTLARRQGKDESYWPVGLSGTFFMCLILKGREEFPGFPRPLIQEFDVQIPLLDMDVPQGQMEERFLREELHIQMLRDALSSDLTSQDISRREFGLDKELIPLIQLACKGDKLQRALDLANLLHHTPSFDMAIKVAQFYHLMGLQEKLTKLKADREMSDRLDEEKERRKKWARQSAPIPAPRSEVPSSSDRRQFEEFAPRSVTIQKSLAPAIPIIGATNALRGIAEPDTSSSSKDSAALPDVPSHSNSGAMPLLGPFDTDEPMLETDTVVSSVSENKRKRHESTIVEAEFSEATSASKRRAFSGADAPDLNVDMPLKISNNPFARKPQDTKNNPFSRLATSKPCVTSKSNSFFDKVDEATGVATATFKPKNKSRDKKDHPRQTTLFGLSPGPVLEKKGRGRQPKDKKGVTTGTTPISTSLDLDVKVLSETDSVSPNAATQSTDITMITTPSNTSSKVGQPAPNDKVPSNSEPEMEWPPSPPQRTDSESTKVPVN